MAAATVVDLGMGNVGSVANMLRKVGGEALVARDPSQLVGARRIILPGVGAFDEAMRRLHERGFIAPLEAVVRDGEVPVLGICLGMQLLADRSDEGTRPGLGWIPGSVTRLPSVGPSGPVRVPHMGWSRVEVELDHPLAEGFTTDSRFYFVHTYAFAPSDRAHVLATTSHGGSPFVAAVARGSVAGVQFHPEKSHRHGMALLRRFLAVGPDDVGTAA